MSFTMALRTRTIEAKVGTGAINLNNCPPDLKYLDKVLKLDLPPEEKYENIQNALKEYYSLTEEEAKIVNFLEDNQHISLGKVNLDQCLAWKIFITCLPILITMLSVTSDDGFYRLMRKLIADLKSGRLSKKIVRQIIDKLLNGRSSFN